MSLLAVALTWYGVGLAASIVAAYWDHLKGKDLHLDDALFLLGFATCGPALAVLVWVQIWAEVTESHCDRLVIWPGRKQDTNQQ